MGGIHANITLFTLKNCVHVFTLKTAYQSGVHVDGELSEGSPVNQWHGQRRN